VFREVRIDDLLARSVIIFLTFIPFFAFRELGRVMGPDKLRDVFFRTGAPKHRPDVLTARLPNQESG
jgi:hypothetical protein